MSKVSSEIVMLSEAYKPLQTSLNKIELYHASQTDSFEKLIMSQQNNWDSDSAKEEFWSSTIRIQSEIEQAKKITQSGFSVAPDPTQANFKLVHQMFTDIEQSSIEYEELAKSALETDRKSVV